MSIHWVLQLLEQVLQLPEHAVGKLPAGRLALPWVLRPALCPALRSSAAVPAVVPRRRLLPLSLASVRASAVAAACSAAAVQRALGRWTLKGHFLQPQVPLSPSHHCCQSGGRAVGKHGSHWHQPPEVGKLGSCQWGACSTADPSCGSGQAGGVALQGEAR